MKSESHSSATCNIRKDFLFAVDYNGSLYFTPVLIVNLVCLAIWWGKCLFISRSVLSTCSPSSSVESKFSGPSLSNFYFCYFHLDWLEATRSGVMGLKIASGSALMTKEHVYMYLDTHKTAPPSSAYSGLNVFNGKCMGLVLAPEVLITQPMTLDSCVQVDFIAAIFFSH
jgi:hypothetical protein